MSAIKKLLAEQDKDFINLHDLLIQIKDANNCTLAEAATALLRLLNQTNKFTMPSLYSYSALSGMVREKWEEQAVIQRIQHAAMWNEFEDSDEIPF